jgi:hypothetical protein
MTELKVKVENKPVQCIYKGYLIKPVFHFTNGKSDFEVYPDEGGEPGSLYPSTTLEKIFTEIDELTESL